VLDPQPAAGVFRQAGGQVVKANGGTSRPETGEHGVGFGVGEVVLVVQGQQPQPGWGAPPPPPSPPKKNKAGKIIGLGRASIVGFFVVALSIGAAVSDGTSSKSDKPAAKATRYEAVKKGASGNKRSIVVEVDSTEGLRGVFNAVPKDLSEEAGYYIVINCSTGGTKDVDSRLANGQYAIGRVGQATTGLKGRGTEFSTNDGRRCPDKAPTIDHSATEKAAGIPPEPTGAKRAKLLRALAAVNPDIVKYEDKAIDAARNQCSTINGGGRRLDWSASQRFTYKTPLGNPQTGLPGPLWLA
jgi:hypothetical protein